MNDDPRIDSRNDATPVPVEREPSDYAAPAIRWEEEFEVFAAATCDLLPGGGHTCTKPNV